MALNQPLCSCVVKAIVAVRGAGSVTLRLAGPGGLGGGGRRCQVIDRFIDICSCSSWIPDRRVPGLPGPESS